MKLDSLENLFIHELKDLLEPPKSNFGQGFRKMAKCAGCEKVKVLGRAPRTDEGACDPAGRDS